MMKDIPVNARVECADGVYGETAAVIIDPVKQMLTHFVVQDSVSQHPVQYLVGVDYVIDTNPNTVLLSCTKDELLAMEHFVEQHYVEKSPPGYSHYQAGEWHAPVTTTSMEGAYDVEETQRIPPGELAVRRGNPVEASDGAVGVVGEFLVEPESGHITHMVLEEGHGRGKKDVTLPVSAIDRVEQGIVYLKLDKKGVDSLPAIPVNRHYDEGVQIEIVAKIYDDVEQANEELVFVKGLDKRKILKILNAAVLVKDQDGQASFEDTRDVDAKSGRRFGAVSGGLVGLLAGGPIGAVVGVLAGAGTGNVAAKWIDMGFSNRFLESFQEKLQPGSAAVVILIEHQWVAELSKSMAGREGFIFQQTLTDEMVQHLLDEGGAEA
jgi:uncharacterized membrane protein